MVVAHVHDGNGFGGGEGVAIGGFDACGDFLVGVVIEQGFQDERCVFGIRLCDDAVEVDALGPEAVGDVKAAVRR